MKFDLRNVCTKTMSLLLVTLFSIVNFLNVCSSNKCIHFGLDSRKIRAKFGNEKSLTFKSGKEHTQFRRVFKVLWCLNVCNATRFHSFDLHRILDIELVGYTN